MDLRTIRETPFIVIDIETTGMSAVNNRITEIALLCVEDGVIVDRFESLLNPEQYIPPFIAEYTGITNTMVFGKPTFAELSGKIEQFIRAGGDRPVIVGHNVQFDYGFLKASFQRARKTFSFESGVTSDLLCTCRLARRLLPKLQRRSLKHVADHFGIRIKARHRAMGDAEATANVLIDFLEMVDEEHEISDLAELLKLQFKRPTDTIRRSKASKTLQEKVKLFPERPGVYTMTNSSGNVIYVGKAKNLHDRVGSYFTASTIMSSAKHSRMIKAVKNITYEETGSELSALLRESRLIKELKPQFNSLERRYRSYTFLKIDIQNPFPKLEATREPSADGAEYYGPFRSRSSVLALVDVLNRSFKLRECGEEFHVGPESKPCFYYEIARCAAPCALLQSKEEYRKEVDRLRRFLSSGDEGVLALVEQMMRDAAERLDFEEAQYLKVRLFEMRRVLGTGDRQLSALNANDFVIMTKTSDGNAEIFFVRYGKLVKQILLTQEHLERSEEWFYRQVRMYYHSGATAIPPSAGKADIDEIRILSSWTDRKKREGSSVIYLGEEPLDMVPRLVRELREMLQTEKVRKTKPATSTDTPATGTAAKRSNKKERVAIKEEGTSLGSATPLLESILDSRKAASAKRIVLKPMSRR